MDGKPVAFRAVLHHPCQITNMKRGSRIVVLPDYQGIGIGYALQTYIAQYYAKRGYVFHTVTSAKNFIYKLNKSKDWKLLYWGTQSTDEGKHHKTVRDRKVATFEYVGEGHARKKYPNQFKMRNTRVKKK